MPQADPAERVVDRREPGPHATAPLQLTLEFGQRDVGRRLDQPLEVGLVGLEHGPPMPAVALGAALPVARTRCISLIAADGLTAKRRAASRIELPRSTARTIRNGRSMEIGAGMATSRLFSTAIVESQAPIPRNRNRL
jgi:hypothetical protein